MLETANVSAAAHTALALASPAPARVLRVIVCSPISAGRPGLESFIQEGFRRSHGAAVQSFMPVLLGLLDHEGRILGAAGYRAAAREQLYLERYLDQPIEKVIGRLHPGQCAARGGIAEIGNFACADSAIAQTLMRVLADFLHDQDQRWVVFTATRAVRRITRRLGMDLREIGRADASRVASATDDWGTYYNSDPRVLLGFVPSWHGAAVQVRGC